MKRRGEDVLASVGVRIAVSEVGARSILKYVKCKELTPRAHAHAPHAHHADSRRGNQQRSWRIHKSHRISPAIEGGRDNTGIETSWR